MLVEFNRLNLATRASMKDTMDFDSAEKLVEWLYEELVDHVITITSFEPEECHS